MKCCGDGVHVDTINCPALCQYLTYRTYLVPLLSFVIRSVSQHDISSTLSGFFVWLKIRRIVCE